MSVCKERTTLALGGIFLVALISINLFKEKEEPAQPARSFLFTDEGEAEQQQTAADEETQLTWEFTELVSAFPAFENKGYRDIHQTLSRLRSFGEEQATMAELFFSTSIPVLRDQYGLDMSDDEIAAVKNEMLNAWSRSYDRWALLSFVDQAVYIENLDTLSSEYATQFIYVTTEDIFLEESIPAEQQSNLQNYLNTRTLELLEHASSEVQATALLAYSHVGESMMAENAKQEVLAFATDSLRSTSTPNALRISAAQMIARSGASDPELETAILEATDTASDPLVLMSLLASAGQIGALSDSPNVLSTLQAYSKHADARVAAVATANLSKLENDL